MDGATGVVSVGAAGRGGATLGSSTGGRAVAVDAVNGVNVGVEPSAGCVGVGSVVTGPRIVGVSGGPLSVGVSGNRD